jgi:hypothetical protein
MVILVTPSPSRTRLRPAPAFVTPSPVMAGLDPAIPMLRGAAFQTIGIAGTSPVMTLERGKMSHIPSANDAVPSAPVRRKIIFPPFTTHMIEGSRLIPP